MAVTFSDWYSSDSAALLAESYRAPVGVGPHSISRVHARNTTALLVTSGDIIRLARVPSGIRLLNLFIISDGGTLVTSHDVGLTEVDDVAGPFEPILFADGEVLTGLVNLDLLHDSLVLSWDNGRALWEYVVDYGGSSAAYTRDPHLQWDITVEAKSAGNAAAAVIGCYFDYLVTPS
jgi:hypothetical protein